MNSLNVPRSVKVIRWIARGWSILVAVVLLMVFVIPALTTTPQSSGENPIKPLEIVLLSLFGVSGLGLLLAWRWEVVGACIAIVSIVVQQLTLSVTSNFWDMGQVIQALFFILPAALFLVAWGLERKAKKVR